LELKLNIFNLRNFFYIFAHIVEKMIEKFFFSVVERHLDFRFVFRKKNSVSNNPPAHNTGCILFPAQDVKEATEVGGFGIEHPCNHLDEPCLGWRFRFLVQKEEATVVFGDDFIQISIVF